MSDENGTARTRQGNAFRDGCVHVQRRRCPTCIYRKPCPLGVAPNRIKQIIEDAVEADTAVICHETYEAKGQAVCRGFFDNNPTTPTRRTQRVHLLRHCHLGHGVTPGSSPPHPIGSDQ